MPLHHGQAERDAELFRQQTFTPPGKSLGVCRQAQILTPFRFGECP